ncbi:MAG: type II toxin-antitoxin system RelE/ParE family toxin [Rhizobium sp.]|nr:type II toxin-antitoxin system RelE/ParE family toxin [Rhizobium sp.]
MRRIVWSDSARNEFRQAIQHIADDDPSVARLVRDRINDAVALLAKRPIGRQGRVTGTYEKPVLRTSHILAYAISDSMLTILHLIHYHRDWPEGSWPEDSE